jgi:formate transporter
VEPNLYDAYSPAEIATRVENLGMQKSKHSILRLFVLSVLAGAFISIGAVFYLVVVSESSLGFGVTRMLGGIAFSLGLILVVIAGAELFTGNNLLAMAWADKKITTRDLLRNWIFSYFGNTLGCLLTVVIIWYAGIAELNQGAIGKSAVQIAESKISLSFSAAVARGVLCNALVCVAIWLVMACRSVTDKILAVIFPVTAFVTIGFEHSIANWFFLPYAKMLDTTIPINEILKNIAAVTIGNIFGGTVLVAGIYYLAYIKKSPEKK